MSDIVMNGDNDWNLLKVFKVVKNPIIPAHFFKIPTHFFKTRCNGCGKEPNLLLHADFSFCSEYACEINFCKKCTMGLMRKWRDKK